MSSVDDTFERAKWLLSEQAAEYQKLGYSLALQKAVPDVFSDGAVKVRWDSKPPHYWPEHWTMTVTKGNGEQVRVKLRDHLNASWLDSIQKPANWNRSPHTEIRLRKEKRKAEEQLNG